MNVMQIAFQKVSLLLIAQTLIASTKGGAVPPLISPMSEQATPMKVRWTSRGSWNAVPPVLQENQGGNVQGGPSGHGGNCRWREVAIALLGP